jgi:hypothetical protein
MENDSNFGSSNWQQRFWDSVRPAVDAGMSIGMDSAGLTSATSKTYQGAQLLRNAGVEVYIEPRPALAQTQWHGFPVISTDTFWDRSDPQHYEDSGWAVPNHMIRGEVIRGILSPPPGKWWNETSWLAPYTRDILAEGHSVATSIMELMNAGVSRAALFA